MLSSNEVVGWGRRCEKVADALCSLVSGREVGWFRWRG